MESFEVVIDGLAEEDLKGILSYIMYTLCEPEAAKRIYTSIKEKILSLNLQPYRYAVIGEEPYASMGVRKLPVENYLAFYYIDEANKTVHVFRILYNRREWKALL